MGEARAAQRRRCISTSTRSTFTSLEEEELEEEAEEEAEEKAEYAERDDEEEDDDETEE